MRKGLLERVWCTKQVRFWRGKVRKGEDGGGFIWREKMVTVKENHQDSG